MLIDDIATAGRTEEDANLLGILGAALSTLNISSTIISVIHLKMHPGSHSYLHRTPPVLEIRGKSGELRAQVEMKGSGDRPAYHVRPSSHPEELPFPLGAHEEAAIYIHSLVRGWRAL